MDEKKTCVIVGGGPAGMFAGLLLARGGVDVVVLEKHADFLRDFRGDTVHPSTLRLLDELGLYDRFAGLPQSKLERVAIDAPGGRKLVVADFGRLRVPHRHVAMVPQWDLLDMLAEAGREEPNFELRMSHEVAGLLHDASGRVAGVRYDSPDGSGELRADLTLVCDGRWSRRRQEAGLAAKEFPVGTDIWWLRVPAAPGVVPELLPVFKDDVFLAVIPRQGYLQIGRFIRKGSDAELRAKGVEALRRDVAHAMPALSEAVAQIGSIDEAKLLDIRINRLPRWHVDGLLCIGDAAHAMSPLGGIGINLAVQDAVAAARILAEPLRERRLAEKDLAAVQRRRMFPAAATQAVQLAAHRHMMDPALAGKPFGAPGWLPAAFARAPWLSSLPARFVGLGFRPEHAPGFARRPSTPRPGPSVRGGTGRA
ncbi:MAG: FAD-dependent oxidoreductase [Segniliparus sp.]|uniref:FAD-dependent oxidoreductase n=1 Tax=Segniliparus sp. TaxID=2804064 RepID=UPI003F3A3A70